MTSETAKQGPVLIYDGQCRLCVAVKERLERSSPETMLVRFLPYQSEEAADCLGADYRPGRPEAALLVTADGTLRSGLEAFVPFLPSFRLGRWIGSALRLPGLTFLAGVAYRVVARHRYRWFGPVNTVAKPGVE